MIMRPVWCRKIIISIAVKPRKLCYLVYWLLTDELASCQDLQFIACVRRGIIIGVEYQELLHSNGPLRSLDSVKRYNNPK